ncbi:MerR family transcriptional regulator [Acetobacter malorum]|uniref:MerR family transcriptional regulator n=1 Tax=Acetobacter malorum TaxID=178901 RepID=UPI0039ECF021
MSDTDHPSSITDLSGLPDEENGALARTEKGPLAFRTISEVADELHVPQHVLRFWETRFEQVRPLKRGGGRRYYRPADVELLRHISDLLYGKGYTVKGVQRLLREGEAEAAQQSPAVTASLPEEIAPEAAVSLPHEVQGDAEAVVADTAQSPVAEPVSLANPEEHEETNESSVLTLPSEIDEPQHAEEQPQEVAFEPENAVEAAAPAPAPAAPEANAVSGELMRRLEKQNVQLKNDLADILVELEAFRNRLTA